MASATNKQKVFAIRTLLILVGVILLLSGLVFMGQGSGYFPYPAESFMIGAKQWIYYGGGIAAVGVVLLLIAWRRWDLCPPFSRRIRQHRGTLALPP